ncbi:PIN domain-containing protein [bacterium]|nr:PIN domain-containing protein [bacterium]
MNGKYFIDTTILIYSFDGTAHRKREIARNIISEALVQSNGIISYQVIQEFLNAALRKFRVPLTAADCRKYLTVVLDPLCEVYAGPGLFHQALEIAERWHYSFYDSLIIAAALQAECTVLYSEDLQRGQKLFQLEIVNPFET